MTTEAAQLARVAELAERYGVLLHHCGDSRYCAGDAGLPDVVLAGLRGVLFRELKSSPRTVTPAQNAWRLTLRAAGVDAGLWLPSDFRSGAVEREIAAIA